MWQNILHLPCGFCALTKALTKVDVRTRSKQREVMQKFCVGEGMQFKPKLLRGEVCCYLS